MGMLMDSLSGLDSPTVIIDSLSMVLGGVDENTSAVAPIMQNLRGMAEYLEGGIIAVHHSVKGRQRFGISAADALRGSGIILANCDLALSVERQTSDPLSIAVRPAAVRGPEVDEFAAKFSYEQKSGSLELESARFWGESVTSIEAEIEAAIMEILGSNGGINQTSLRAEAAAQVSAATDPTIRRVIARMERSGSLQVRKGKQNAKIYSLGNGNG